MIINIIVAASNLVALFFGWRAANPVWSLIIPTMVFSILYHLSEKKHGLPGIYPLNKYWHLLIWLDRIYAINSAIYIINNMNPNSFPWFTALIGLAGLSLSEADVIVMVMAKKRCVVGQIDFALYHSIWHVAAFYCLTSVM